MDWTKHCRVSGWVKNQRWRPVTGSGYGITYISACTHDSNKILTNILMFLTSSITTGLILILVHFRVCGKFVVYIQFRLLPPSWYTTHHNIGQYSHKCSHVARFQNIGIAIGIVLLSRTAKLHVIWYAYPVPGRHLWFLTHTDKQQCIDQSSRVAWHRK